MSSHGAASAKKDSEASAVHAIGSAKSATMAGAEASRTVPNATPVTIPAAQVDRRLADQRRGVGPGPVDARRRDEHAGGDDGDGDRRASRAARTRLATSLAPRTRERTGTSAKVIIPVRWDHSEVTSRMPAIGSRTAAGLSPTSRTDGERVVRRVADEQADDHGDHGERDGGDLQPEAGAGVDHLAQLDGDEAAEAGARVDAGGVHAGSVR